MSNDRAAKQYAIHSSFASSPCFCGGCLDYRRKNNLETRKDRKQAEQYKRFAAIRRTS